MDALKARTVSLLVVLYSCLAMSAEIPLSEFPVFTQATYVVGSCVSKYSSSLSISYGCPAEAAACLCTDPIKSQRAAYGIRSDMYYQGSTNVWTATQLWKSYCSINAGVSALDETIVQDIPYYTRVTLAIANCVASATNSYITTFGCDAYTKAQCLCENSASYSLVQEDINSCIYYTTLRESASSLWSSYCAVNLATPAERVIESPALTITDGVDTSPSGTDGVPTSGTTTRTGSSRTSTTAANTATNGGNASDVSSDPSSSVISPGAIAGIVVVIIIAICAFVAFFIIRYRRRRLQSQPPPNTNLYPSPRPFTTTAGNQMVYQHANSAGSYPLPLTNQNLQSRSDSEIPITPDDSASRLGPDTYTNRGRLRDSWQDHENSTILSTPYGQSATASSRMRYA